MVLVLLVLPFIRHNNNQASFGVMVMRSKVMVERWDLHPQSAHHDLGTAHPEAHREDHERQVKMETNHQPGVNAQETDEEMNEKIVHPVRPHVNQMNLHQACRPNGEDVL